MKPYLFACIAVLFSISRSWAAGPSPQSVLESGPLLECHLPQQLNRPAQLFYVSLQNFKMATPHIVQHSNPDKPNKVRVITSIHRITGSIRMQYFDINDLKVMNPFNPDNPPSTPIRAFIGECKMISNRPPLF